MTHSNLSKLKLKELLNDPIDLRYKHIKNGQAHLLYNPLHKHFIIKLAIFNKEKGYIVTEFVFDDMDEVIKEWNKMK